MRLILTALVVLLLWSVPVFAQDKLRVIIETDAGGDPDDEQSLVRFLLYANEWDVEGIIANRPTARPRENLNPVRTGLGIVQQHVSAYGQVYEHLKAHAPGFPSKAYLWDRTVSGYAGSDAGVDLIMAARRRRFIFHDHPAQWGPERFHRAQVLQRDGAKQSLSRARGGLSHASSRGAAQRLQESPDQWVQCGRARPFHVRSLRSTGMVRGRDFGITEPAVQVVPNPAIDKGVRIPGFN